MIEYHMTLRKVFQIADFNKVSERVYKDRITKLTLTQLKEKLSELFNELCSCPTATDRKSNMVFLRIPEESDCYPLGLEILTGNTEYAEEPPEGLSPWGGKPDIKEDCPEGYFNVNWTGYNKYFGLNSLDFSEFVDSPVFFENLDAYGEVVSCEDLAYIAVSEIIAYGITKKEREKFWAEMDRRMKNDNWVPLEEVRKMFEDGKQ